MPWLRCGQKMAYQPLVELCCPQDPAERKFCWVLLSQCCKFQDASPQHPDLQNAQA